MRKTALACAGLVLPLSTAAQAQGEARREESRHARDHPLWAYAHYPAGIRPLLQKADIDHDLCRNGPSGQDPNGPLAMRICNAEFHTLGALEDQGWCWGGSHTEAEKRWLRCARDPVYNPGAFRGAAPFSAQDIAEAEHQATP